jgi:hypothetical protein
MLRIDLSATLPLYALSWLTAVQDFHNPRCSALCHHPHILHAFGYYIAPMTVSKTGLSLKLIIKHMSVHTCTNDQQRMHCISKATI